MVESFLKARGLCQRIHYTTDLDAATAIARQVCAEASNPLIIVGGGDGTINGVINGLSPATATLAVLPFGTSNVLTKELRINSLEDALHRIARGESRPVSVGMIQKEAVQRYFLLMAGIGFDGSVVQGVRFFEKRMLGKGAYLLSALRNFAGWDNTLMEVSDGKVVRTCHSLIICNCSRYAGDFRIAPEASLFEPDLDIIGISRPERISYLHAAVKLLMGKNRENRGIVSFKAKELTVFGDKPVQIDGDFFCRAPAKISILPDFLRLIV